MAVAPAVPAGARAAGTDTYIIQLTDAPLATYDGGTKGIPGTSPSVTGRKLKADSAPGIDYRAFLASRQASLLGRLPGAAPHVLYSYRYALGGFAVKLTPAQADALRARKDVASVERSALEHVMEADPDT